jgi:O-antigen/teichoic acid export membrane protein
MLMLAGALGTSIIVARWLGTIGVGSLAVLSVTVALSVQLGCAGLPSANTYFISKDRAQLARVWSNALLFAMLAGSAIALLVIVLARLKPTLFGEVPLELLTLAAASIPFQLINLLGLNVLLGMERVTQFNLLDALSQLLLLVNACLAFALRVDLFVLVLFNTVAAVLVAITVVVIIFREIGKLSNEVLQLDPQLFKRMIRYGLKFYISVVAGIIILRVDLLLVNKLRGSSEAGIYAIAAQMSTLLILLPSVIATLLFPRVSAVKDIDGELTMRATRHTAFVMFIVCILAVPLAFALPYVYGQSFRGSTLQLLILLPGVLLLGIESVMVQHFNAQGLPFTIPLFWIICVLVNVVLNLIFIPRFGAIGAAVISTVTYALIFVLVATYFRTKTGNRLSTVLFLRQGELRQLLNPKLLGASLR